MAVSTSDWVNRRRHTKEVTRENERGVDTMERKTFWLFVGLAFISGLVGGGLSDWVFPWGNEQHARFITAEKIRLVGEDGSPGIFLLDRDGETRITLSLSQNGSPGMFLSDRKGKSRVGLSLQNGNPFLRFSDQMGESRVSLSLHDGSSLLTFLDKSGDPRFIVGLSQDGSPSLIFHDKDSRVIWSAP